jgi:hypothetical protein
MLQRTPNYLLKRNTLTRGALTKRFKTAWKMGVTGIIKAGQVLLTGKEQLDHGEFLDWLRKDLHLHERKAQMLMLIARHPVLSNAKFVSHLPASWGTLYELTHLCRPNQNPQRMLDLIASGQINPFMTREDAQALLTGRKQDPEQLILAADLTRVMRRLDRLTTEQAIANLQTDPGSTTPDIVNKFGHRLVNIAKQWERQCAHS